MEPLEKQVSKSDAGWAAGVHVASIFWPLIGPIVGLALFRTRPFVLAHAKQALLETLILNVAVFLAGLASLTYTVFRVVHFVQTNWQDFHWQEFLLRFLIGWILFGLLEIVTIVVSVRQALGALRGDWPRQKKEPAPAGRHDAGR